MEKFFLYRLFVFNELNVVDNKHVAAAVIWAEFYALFARVVHEEPISVSLARNALSEAVSENGKEELNENAVLNAVTAYYHISKTELTNDIKFSFFKLFHIFLKLLPEIFRAKHLLFL